jgi:hypothetical protein
VVVSSATEWTDHHGILELFGLRRSTAYHLDNEGLIKSVSLAEHGEKRGKRLFYVPSIREYLNSKLKRYITKHEDVWSQSPNPKAKNESPK